MNESDPVAASVKVEGRPRVLSVELIETVDEIVLVMEVPHAEREDLRVDVSPRRVVIAALPRENQGGKAGWGTNGYQPFERAIPLSVEVVPTAVTARVNNCVLEVQCPKKQNGGTGVTQLHGGV